MTNGVSRCKGSVSDWGIGSKGDILVSWMVSMRYGHLMIPPEKDTMLYYCRFNRAIDSLDRPRTPSCEACAVRLALSALLALEASWC
jgi:hypothetical protein